MNLDELPDVHFAASGGTHVAYQLFGGGGVRNFVVVPGFVTHLEQMWDVPMIARIYERLAAIGRVVAFDKRGTGLSERSVGVPALGERIEDITLRYVDQADLPRPRCRAANSSTTKTATGPATYASTRGGSRWSSRGALAERSRRSCGC